eukprot:TRINITY_DN8637_c1_g1_i1.p1 TRINITY_DN8637_c1_g1~~TRINITY_DN8637_c1_g1_i1.p1  ORF type:complete len:539 (+),score=60.51 TRINITY_DN8637_c1_g1_i1:83-1618(+)
MSTWILKQSRSIPISLKYILLGSFVVGNAFVFQQLFNNKNEVYESLKTVPRTVRTMWWAQSAAREYSSLLSQYQSHEGNVEYEEKLAALHKKRAKELLKLCESNGGVYVKAGQFAGTIQSVPEEYRVVLATLQDDAPMCSFDQIKAKVEKELQTPIEAIFSAFSEEPAAAASIAQVHKAVRKDNGEQVAVKVQYPGISKAIKADMYTLKWLSRTAASFFREYQLTWIFEELEKKLNQELDFRIEATNNRSCIKQISHPKVTCPKVYEDLSTEQLLTMEWIEGVKVTDIEGMRGLNIEPRTVAMDMLNVFAQMTFVKGYIHGDPHAGNVLVRPLKGNGSYEIVLLDHGHYIQMSQELREQYCQLWCSFVLGDDDASMKIAMRIAGEKGRLLPEILNPKKGQKKRSVAAFSKALEQFPRPLVDTIRVNGIVRQIVTVLGASLTDRLYMNGGAAILGLPQMDFDGKSVSDTQFWLVQFRVGMQVRLLRWGIWLESTLRWIRCLWTGEEFMVRID